MAHLLKPLLLDMAAGSHTEAACIRYDLHQAMEDENTFIFQEKWASAEGLEDHRKTKHVQQYRQLSVTFTDGPMVLYTTQQLA